ncbi:hypothetical protein [Micromonospora tulbaghiae]
MDTTPRPRNQSFARPGAVTGLLGGLAVSVGAIVMIANYETPGFMVDFYIGTVLIGGGLLLRIESAIRSAGHRP